MEAFRAYCEAQGWPLVDKPRSWKSKKGAQEAHEAIRPTHIEVGEAGETADEKALYRLIRLRALAAQLADAVYAVRVLRLGGDVDGKQAFFEGKGRTLLDQGWKALMAADDTEDPAENAETDNPVPAMKAGTRATALSSKTLTKKTKPPARFTEASLVRELEKRGIGRPSTYAAILGTIMEPSKENLAGRGYVKEAEKRQLAPTPLGEAVVDGLHGHFAFADYEYTRNMEQSLDDIAEGKAEYRATVSAAFEQLTREVAAFKKAAGQVCPECGGLNLRRKVKQADKKDGRAWDFFACPDCANTFGNVGGKPGPKQEKREKTLSEFMCPECGKPLIRQQGQKKDGSGEYDFYGCSGYPKCGAFYPTKEDGTPDLNVFKCPECGKILKRRQGKKKDGSGEYDFYGCSGFPKCKATYQTKEDGTPDFERKQK